MWLCGIPVRSSWLIVFAQVLFYIHGSFLSTCSIHYWERDIEILDMGTSEWKNQLSRTSLVVQGVSTLPSNAGGVLRSQGRELKYHMSHGQKNKTYSRNNIVTNSINDPHWKKKIYLPMQKTQVPSLVGELWSHIASRQLSTSTREPACPKEEPVCHN